MRVSKDEGGPMLRDAALRAAPQHEAETDLALLPPCTVTPLLYATARCGKIFHLGVPSGLESMDDPEAWDFGTPFKSELPYPPKRESAVTVKTGKKQGLVWQEIPCEDDDLCDGFFAKTAIEWLGKRDTSKPFFLAVGFHRPTQRA